MDKMTYFDGPTDGVPKNTVFFIFKYTFENLKY